MQTLEKIIFKIVVVEENAEFSVFLKILKKFLKI